MNSPQVEATILNGDDNQAVMTSKGKVGVAVSVVIPCFNYGRYVTEAVDSVLASDFQDFEIIIVDDGSTDPATVEVLKNLNRPKTRVIRQTNAGQAAARNAGIRLSRGKYVLPLDADDAIDPTYLGKAARLLEADPDIGFVYTHMSVFGAENFVWLKSPYNFYKLLWENGVGVCSMIRHSAFDETPGYRTGVYEDWDLWISLSKRGWRGQLLPEPLFRYRWHGPSAVESDRRRRGKLIREMRRRHADIYADRQVLAHLRQQWMGSAVAASFFHLALPLREFIRSRYFPLKWRRKLIKFFFSYFLIARNEGLMPNAKHDAHTKIIYVVTRAERGGAQANVLALARAAKLSGHEVTVAVGEPGWLADELRAAGVPVEIFQHLRRSWSPRRVLLYFSELKRLLRRLKPDVVHFHSSNALLGIIAARSLGPTRPKIVATIHGWSILHPGWRRSRLLQSLYRAVMRFVLRRADHVILVCEADRKLARQQKLIPEAKMRVIHNGLRPDFEFLPAVEARRVLDAADKEFVVGTVARADYPKNLELLVQIAVSLRPRGFVWRIVGNGPENEKLRRLIGAGGLGESVKIIDDYPEPPKLMSGFDVFVMTSRFEGLPYALLEAGLAARPVVATAVGGVPEIIEHGRTGRLAPAGDAAALAREIIRFFENPEAARQMGEALWEKVQREFSEQVMVEKTFQACLE